MLLPDSTYKTLWHSLAGVFTDPHVDELLVNRFDAAWLLRGRQQKAWASPFDSSEQYFDWLLDFAYRRQVRLDPVQGSAGGLLSRSQLRWHILLPPMAVEGPILSLRQHRFHSIGLEQFVVPPSALLALENALCQPGLIIVAGPTGSGKTTMLNALLSTYCLGERVLILETIAELGMATTKWVRLVERGVGIDGQGIFSLGKLFVEALRLRPERIVVGEVRGHEASVLLQAIATGHGAVLCSLHASDASMAIRRLMGLCGEHREDLAHYPLTVVQMEGQGVPRIKSVHTRQPTSCQKEF